MAPPTQNNQTNNENSFESFFNRWMVEQENYLGDLLRAISECNDNENEPRCRNLIDGVMILYNQYYEAKTRLIQENVFSALTPSWLSPFERTYLWLGGFRPGVAFRLVTNNVHDLTEEQSQRIDRLMRAIKHNEQQLSDELNRVQDRMVSSEMVELARHMGRLRNGAAHNVESALDSMRMSMEIKL